MHSLITIENMDKVYNPGENEVRALDGVNLTIEEKEYVAIIGQSGSGKSTLMKLLSGHLAPDGGYIDFGYRVEIDPDPLYLHAKTIDGDPTGDGTYLECTLDALLENGYFDRAACKVKTFGGSVLGLGSNGLASVKNAIHRYGVCIAGFNITGEWFSPKGGIIRGTEKSPEGCHAVTLVGYDAYGVLIMNSWGRDYAHDGKVYITNKAFDDQFIYGSVLTHCLDGME